MRKTILAVFVGLALALGLAPAQAATPVASVGHIDTIPSAVSGKAVDSYDTAVINQLNKVKKGGAAYVGVYSIGPDSADVVDAMLAMADRGGKLYLLTWRQNGGNQDEPGKLTSTQLKRVKIYLSKHKDRGWFKDCIGGCRRSGTKGIQHVKIWAWDFGDGTYAAMQGSGNSTGDTPGRGFNGFDFVYGPGAKPVFDQYRTYVTTSRADKNLPDIADVTVPIKDGTLTSRVLPNKKGDLIDSELANARGYKAKPGEPGCHLVIDQFKVTVNRLDLYDEGIRIAREGCWVEVDLNWKPGDQAKRFEAKVAELKAAGVWVWDGSYSPKYPGQHYDHNKRAGGVTKTKEGKIRRWKVQGSLTASASATSVSSEQQMLFVSPSEAQHVFDRQAQMRQYLRRI